MTCCWLPEICSDKWPEDGAVYSLHHLLNLLLFSRSEETSGVCSPVARSSVLAGCQWIVVNLFVCLSVAPQISRCTGTGWPSHTVCRCLGGTMRSVSLLWYSRTGSHLKLPRTTTLLSVVLTMTQQSSVFIDDLYMYIFNLCVSLCRTRRSGLLTIPRCLLGSSLACHTSPGTLTETCCWWTTWTMPAHPRSSSRGCQSSSQTCFLSLLPESEFPVTGSVASSPLVLRFLSKIFKTQTYFLMPPYWLFPPSGVAGAFKSRKALETFWTGLPSSLPCCWSGTLASLLLTVSFSCEHIKSAGRDVWCV